MILKSFLKLAAIAYVLVSVSSIEQVVAMDTIAGPFTGSPPDTGDVDRILESPRPNSENMKTLLEYVKASPTEFNDHRNTSPGKFKEDRVLAKIAMFMLRDHENEPEDQTIIKEIEESMQKNGKSMRFYDIRANCLKMKRVFEKIRNYHETTPTSPNTTPTSLKCMQTNHACFSLIFV